jgi:hypothetical protein
MMGMRMPETCWAVFKRQAINLKNCCIWLVDSFECVAMHGLKTLTCTFYLLSDLHFLFLGISGSLRRRLSPGPGRCLSTQFGRCAVPPPPCSSLCNGRQIPERGVPLPLLGCRLRVSVDAVASSSWSRESRYGSEPVLVVGLQHANSSSSSLFDVVEDSSSRRTSCTSLRRYEWVKETSTQLHLNCRWRKVVS